MSGNRRQSAPVSKEHSEEERRRYEEKAREIFAIGYPDEDVATLSFDGLHMFFQGLKNSRVNPDQSRRVGRILDGDHVAQIASDEEVTEAAIYNARKVVIIWVAQRVGFEKVVEILSSEDAEAQLYELFRTLGSMRSRSEQGSRQPKQSRPKQKVTLSSNQTSAEFWKSSSKPDSSRARYKVNLKKTKSKEKKSPMPKVIGKDKETRVVDGEKVKFKKIILEGWDPSKREKRRPDSLSETERLNLK